MNKMRKRATKILIVSLLIIGVILISGCVQKLEKQKTLLDNKEIYCNSSKEKAREVCLSYAVNEMGRNIAWAGTHLVCEDDLCKVTE